MIKYKVVQSNRRSIIVGNDDFMSSPYKKYYEAGYTTKAEPGTLGIFVFHHRNQAKKWIEHGNRSYQILRVRPVGKGKTPKFIGLWHTPKNLNNFYDIKKQNILDPNMTNAQIPTGTICYPAVEVLD